MKNLVYLLLVSAVCVSSFAAADPAADITGWDDIVWDGIVSGEVSSAGEGSGNNLNLGDFGELSFADASEADE